MSDYLPEEVEINILHRLPVKTLLRCRSVCKSWYSLITSPHFISTHLNFNKNKAPSYISLRCFDVLKTDPFKEKYALYYDNPTFDSYTKFDIPFVVINGVFSVMGSCNGLICLFGNRMNYKKRIILWNPFVNKAVFLPEPMYGDGSEDEDDGDLDESSEPSLGFGYDFATNDYKLVRIVNRLLDEICPIVEVYRLSTRVWEDISHLALAYLIIGSSVFVNGAIHWIGVDEERNYMIILFDIHSEVFDKMMLPLPSCLENRVNYFGEPFVDCEGSTLFDCQGSLCLIHRGELGGQRLDIWLMKEYGAAESWIKQYSISCSVVFRPLGFRNNGESLWSTNKGCTISYHPQSKQMTELPIRGKIKHVGAHVESLLLLDSDNVS